MSRQRGRGACPAGAAGTTRTRARWAGPRGPDEEAGGVLRGEGSKKREGRSDQRKGKEKEKKKGDLEDLPS